MARLALVGAFLISAAGAHASDWVHANGLHELAITPGYFVPTTKFDVTRNGVGTFEDVRFGRGAGGFSISYLYNLTRIVSFGVEAGYLNRRETQIDGFLTNGVTRVRGDSRLGLALVRLRTPARSSPVSGYAIAGFGVHRTDFDLYTYPAKGFVWLDNNGVEERPWIRDTKERFATALRLGVEYGFADGGVIGLEGGWLRLMSATYPLHPHATGVSDVTVGGDGYMIAARLAVRVGGRP